MIQAARFSINYHLLVPFIVEAALPPGMEFEELLAAGARWRL